MRRAAFALLAVRAAAKLSAAVVMVPAARLCAHTPIGGWDFAPPCVNRVCAPADMGGAKAGPVRDKSPHWSRPYLGRQPCRDAQRRADIVQKKGSRQSAWNLPSRCVMVQVRAADQATARKSFLRSLAPGTNEIALVNQAKAATGRDVWVADVRSLSHRSRLLTARPL